MPRRLVKISEWPYKERKIFREAADWINAHPKNLQSYEEFDYPDYWGLPNRIANKLSPDEVDFIQEQIFVFVEHKPNE